MNAPRKIAVLGGGIGSLSAVFEITSTPDWQSHFEVTVYERSWRLGGKGASGRNSEKHLRNEEHGLHIWMGFYDNAFDLIRRCYEELDPRHGHGWSSWRDAFSPLNGFVLTEKPTDHLLYELAARDEQPGKRPPRKFIFWHYAVRLSELIARMYFDSALPRFYGLDAEISVLSQRDRIIDAGIMKTPEHLMQMCQQMPSDPRLHTQAQHDEITRTADEILRLLEKLDRDVRTENEIMKYWNIVNLGVAILRGLIVDGIVYKSFDEIEKHEWSDWMTTHGAPPEALKSAPVRACYDLVFGYANGDAECRSVGAGTGTHCLLRLLLDYREAVAYELSAGMGESIFTPLYLVLLDRGVKFKFFHHVERLKLTADSSAIDRIDIDVEREIPEDRAYDPLISVKGLLCWSSAPPPERAANNRRGRLCALRKGVHFDDVILGIPLPALGGIVGDLAVVSQEWRDMLTHVSSTATLAAQFWTTITTYKAGWQRPSTLLGGFEKPFDTAWDADKTIQWENHPAGNVPKSSMYLCGTLADALDKPGLDPYELTEQWLRDHGASLWRGTSVPMVFDWKSLYDPAGGDGAERLKWQHVSANVDASNRYVQSRPGTSKYRMWADKSGFSNLYLAGDWVKTSLNAGCMEAATMAGLRAARSITGRRLNISGEDELFDSATPAWPFPGAELARVVGSADVMAVIIPIEIAALQAMIPSGLRLLDAPHTPKNHHPVGFLFCRHSDVRPWVAPPVVGLRYNEIAIAVPYVTTIEGGSEEAHTVLPLLLLDDLFATLSGRAFFGFKKTLARMTVGSGNFSASRLLTPSRLLSIESRASAPARPWGNFPKLELAQKIFEQPVLVHHLGGWRRTYMDFDLTSAIVTPLTGTMTIHSQFVAGLAVGSHKLDSIELSNFGAFAFSSSWQLSTAG